MQRRNLLLLLLLLGLLFGAAPACRAHGMRTGYLELTESGTSALHVRWRGPESAGTPALALPAHCQLLGTDGSAAPSPPGPLLLREGSFHLRCARSLSGEVLHVVGMGPLLSEVVGLARLRDGHVSTHLLTAASPRWPLHSVVSVRATATEYVGLGLRHILSGADHLLFLVLLVLAVRRVRGILLAETAFTLSHSLSFSATALGWVQVSSAAAEACIALSLLLLALDVERPSRALLSSGRATALALSFGLVHGLGFAGGLREIGVPEQAAAWALLGFGVGVELGQLVFLLLLLGLLQLVTSSRLLRPAALVATYAAGGLSACWLIERVRIVLAAAGPS